MTWDCIHFVWVKRIIIPRKCRPSPQQIGRLECVRAGHVSYVWWEFTNLVLVCGMLSEFCVAVLKEIQGSFMSHFERQSHSVWCTGTPWASRPPRVPIDGLARVSFHYVDLIKQMHDLDYHQFPGSRCLGLRYSLGPNNHLAKMVRFGRDMYLKICSFDWFLRVLGHDPSGNPMHNEISWNARGAGRKTRAGEQSQWILCSKSAGLICLGVQRWDLRSWDLVGHSVSGSKLRKLRSTGLWAGWYSGCIQKLSSGEGAKEVIAEFPQPLDSWELKNPAETCMFWNQVWGPAIFDICHICACWKVSR